MNFESILKSKKHNSHYTNRYIKFIYYCKNKNCENGITKQNFYMESHHICPASKHMFPEYSSFKNHPWNKIDLTARQHFIAHWLLWKSYNNPSVAKAFYLMKKSSNNQERYFKITSKVFESIKLTHKQFKHSEQSKKKISNTLKQKFKSGQLTISEANRKACSEYQKNRIWTEESKLKSSNTRKSKELSKGKNNSQYGIKFRWMNNSIINKKVKLIEVEAFLNSNWNFGRIKK